MGILEGQSRSSTVCVVASSVVTMIPVTVIDAAAPTSLSSFLVSSVSHAKPHMFSPFTLKQPVYSLSISQLQGQLASYKNEPFGGA